MSRRFFTSDLHLMHANIILHCNRPWLADGDVDQNGKWISQDVKMARAIEMTEALISNWNAVIREGDEVWVLGDFMMNTNAERISKNLSRLNGTKHLVVGNHDPKIGKCLKIDGWSSVAKSLTMIVGGVTVYMAHHKEHDFTGGDFMLHGHSHNKIAKRGRFIDVGVDGNNYMPYYEDEIARMMVEDGKV